MLSPAERLERAFWDNFWIPDDVQLLDRPDVLARRSPRPVAYLNMVARTRTSAPRALVAEVLGWYRELSGPRPISWAVTDTWDAAALPPALADAGFREGDRHEVRVLEVERWRGGRGVEVRPISTLEGLLDAHAVADAAFGRASHPTEASLQRDLAECLKGEHVHRFVAYDGARPISTGGMSAFPALGIALLWGGSTVPDARGRGAYRAVLDARLERARALTIPEVGLYAKEATSAPIVARHGFRRLGCMVTWEHEGPAAA